MKPQIRGALQEVQRHFKESLYPTLKQSDLRDRNVKLLNETPQDWESLSNSATYRHKAVQNIFTSIVERFGHTEFFLAAHALSPNALQSVNDFVNEYGKWLKDAEIPANFVSYAVKSEANHDVGSNSDISRSSVIRSPKRCIDGGVSQQIPSKRRHISTNDSGLEAVHLADQRISEGSGEAVISDNDREDIEEAESEPLPTDAPMAGPVYVVECLDAIRAIVNEQHPHAKLTIPDHDLHRPFITFQCSERSAKEILKKSERIL